ncbi:hypothetical protein LV79_003358 [Actinokineospora globicatena]|nr:hypothetical protein [Actinokineospora globicatena]GLW79210.1 hypothetical protein Aglo01_36920 [Actinokineospora globicatena]GLW86380.1 hypothetical protein Aglo02_40190 [Actinokineospora globicatena]
MTSSVAYVGPDPATFWPEAAITIGTNDGYDLDAATPDSGRVQVVNSKADIRLITDLAATQRMTGAEAVSSYADCVGAPTRKAIPAGELKVGSTFCVETTEGRWARLGIADVRVEPSKTEVDLSVIVWQRAA